MTTIGTLNGMAAPHLVVTGFREFADVRVNASGLIAQRLDGTLVHEVPVRAETLPTAYEAARARALELAGDPGCRAVLALGVWRGDDFRLERRARGVVRDARPDNDGQVWAGRILGEDRETTLPVAELAAAIGARVSDDCGDYVCNATYHALLSANARALFLHVPRDVRGGALSAAEAMVRALLPRLLRQDVPPALPTTNEGNAGGTSAVSVVPMGPPRLPSAGYAALGTSCGPRHDLPSVADA